MSTSHAHKKVAVIALGNMLAGDDGVGAAVIADLRNRILSPAVHFIDGEVGSLAILYHLEDGGYDAVVFVDAVDGLERPGDLIRLEGEEIASNADGVDDEFVSVSLHEISFRDVLMLAEALERLLPPQRILWGIQVEPLRLEGSLSEAVRTALPRLTQEVEAEIRKLLPYEKLDTLSRAAGDRN